MNISLPPGLKEFVDDQVQRGEYASSSEYVRELIRKDQQRTELRGLLMAGASSEAAAPATPEYFAALRTRVDKAPKRGARR